MFRDRTDAGQKLAEKLLLIPSLEDVNKDDLLVLSIPRGGVILGGIIADALRCKHDVLIVRKIGFPKQEELAIGAAAEDALPLLNIEFLQLYRLKTSLVQKQIRAAQAKIKAYKKLFRHDEPLDVHGRVVILVDDGIATGETVKAGVQWLHNQTLKMLIVAVPVCSVDTAVELSGMVDIFVCLHALENFVAVGRYYDNFDQVSNEEVVQVLHRLRTA